MGTATVLHQTQLACQSSATQGLWISIPPWTGMRCHDVKLAAKGARDTICLSSTRRLLVLYEEHQPLMELTKAYVHIQITEVLC